MRIPKYLSYSSFSLFEKDPQAFFVKYLAETKLPREPQNHYMAVGSAFDAYVKAALYKSLVGGSDPRMEVNTLFEAQVEEHNRDVARVDGATVFETYCKVGAYKALCEDMRGCIGEPKFESEIVGKVGVATILGKPDVQYINREGCQVTHDFKVNGFYSKTPPPPKAGYISLLPGGAMHRSVIPMKHRGLTINASGPLNMTAVDWAEQLSMYAWVMGAEVGSDYVLTIDQICCNSQTKEQKVARHAATCQEAWQRNLYERIQRCWKAIETGHIFLGLPYEQNLAKIATLELTIASVKDDTAFNDMTKRVR